MPVFSYIESVGTPALALHAAISHASLTKVSSLSFFPPSGGSCKITLKCFGTLLRRLMSLLMSSGVRWW